MDFLLLPLILSLIDVAVLGTFAISRTVLNYKSYKLQKEMLEESRTYWGSWKERSKDVAEKVLKEITTKQLQDELKKRKEKQQKKEDKEWEADDQQVVRIEESLKKSKKRT